MNKKTASILWIVCLLVGSSHAFLSFAGDWPQFMRDAAHTARTPDSPAPPYEVAWAVSFSPETLGTVQPIVQGGVLYVPTLQGRLYALEPRTGARLWVQEGLGTVSRSAAAADGLVYVANVEGKVHAVKTERGSAGGVGGAEGIAWTAELGFGISATPCVDGGRLYIGTRAGSFFALDCRTGATVWERRLDGQVWAGAAAAEGKVYVATDRDIRMYCLDAGSGAVLWKSERLPGIFVRDWTPVVSGGKVFVRTMLPEYRYFKPEPYYTWWAGEGEKVFAKYQPELRAGRLPEEFKAANEELARHLAENRTEQTLFAFDAATGAVPYVCAVMQVFAQWFGCPPPPAVDGDGLLQVPVPYAPSRFGRFDAQTGRIADIIVGDIQAEGKSKGHDGLGTNSDESHGSAVGGDRVFWVHWNLGGCDTSLMFDIKTREIVVLPQGLTGGRKPVNISVQPVEKTPVSGADNLYNRAMQNAAAGPAIWEDFYFHFSGGGSFLYAVKGGRK